MRTSILLTETSFSLHIYGPRALRLAQALANGRRCPFYKNLYHPLDIIHIRPQRTDSGSGACQYNIQGRVPFLQEPLIFLRKPFHIIHTSAQILTSGSGACQYNIQGRVPFLQERHILHRKTCSRYTFKGSKPCRSLNPTCSGVFGMFRFLIGTCY